MKIGTIIILENLGLQAVIGYLGGGLTSTDHQDVRFFIKSLIFDTPNRYLGEYSVHLKEILKKYRALIVETNSNEEALKLLVENWTIFFSINPQNYQPYQADFSNMLKLIDKGLYITEIFIGVNNGILANQTKKVLPNAQRWKLQWVSNE